MKKWQKEFIEKFTYQDIDGRIFDGSVTECIEFIEDLLIQARKEGEQDLVNAVTERKGNSDIDEEF